MTPIGEKVKRKAKKQVTQRPSVTMRNCNITSQPEPVESIRLRAEAIKAAAEALGKIADALKSDTRSAPMIQIGRSD